MFNRRKISAFLFAICFASCSSTSTHSYSFQYTGTLADSGTIKITVEVQCPTKGDVAKIEKNITTIKRALAITFIRQKTESLQDSGKYKIENSLYKIIEQFSHANYKRIIVTEFEVTEK